MAEYFAGGHIRFLDGEWRDDNGDVVEIKEVKHGYWVDDGFGRGNLYCSVCKSYPVEDEDGNPLSVLADWEPEYCPNCGTKMEERPY